MEKVFSHENYLKYQNKLMFKVMLFIEVLVLISTVLVLTSSHVSFPGYMLYLFMGIFILFIAITVIMNVLIKTEEVKQLVFLIIAILFFLVDNLFYINSLGIAGSFLYFGLLLTVYISQNRKYFFFFILTGLLFYISTNIFLSENRIISISSGYYYNRYVALVGFIYVAFEGMKINNIYKENLYEQIEEVESKNLELQLLNRELNETKQSLNTHYDKIYQLAYYDKLTNLTNRSYFINQLLKHSQESPKETYTLLMMDIENLKYINNTYSHAIGDTLLYEVSKMIRELLPEADAISRMGGDEIGIFISGESSYEFIAEKIVMMFSQAIHVGDVDLRIAINIGIVYNVMNSIHYEEALRFVDIALQNAKEALRGKSNYVVYTPELSKQIYERIHLSKELHSALEEGKIKVIYQPKYDAMTLRVVGFEALARWTHESLGVISPENFVAIAEAYGLIDQLTDYVIEKASAFSEKIYSLGLTCKITINISCVQLGKEGFSDELIGFLRNLDIPIDALGIEITETAVMESLDNAMSNLQAIRKAGIFINLDDFGKGYSSLTYLRHLPIDVIKIDKSFIDNICLNINDEHMIRMIINLAKDLGIKSVAEGVEVREQYDLLKEIGCDYIQGYLFSKPISEEKCLKLIY